MHLRTKAKTKDITKLVLQLAGTGLLTVLASGMARHPGQVARLDAAFRDYRRKRIRQTFARLKMQGMIQYDRKDSKSPLRVTQKGLRRIAKYELDAFRQQKKSKRWDYLWRVVVFDIPENRRALRETVRSELKKLGFYQLQKSVYVVPFDVEREIYFLGKGFGVSRYLIFCVTPNLGIKEQTARNHFMSRGISPKNL